jgi:hypothetical protein
VTTFLSWASAPEHDERKLVGIKALTIIGVMWVFALYQKVGGRSAKEGTATVPVSARLGWSALLLMQPAVKHRVTPSPKPPPSLPTDAPLPPRSASSGPP